MISVELDQKLYENASRSFSNDPQIYQGDSGQVIEKLLKDLDQPCLFWLDGRYSEGFTAKGELNTPIINELKHIFNDPIKNHVILIDDARCFIGENDYPSMQYLKGFVAHYNNNLSLC